MPLPPLQILVTRDPQGRVNVNGPLEDKLTCLKMLAIAMQAVCDFEPRRIALPTGVQIPPALSRDGKGR